MESRDIIIGACLILISILASSGLVLYSRRLIERIAKLKHTSLRDILQDRHARG